MTETINVFLNSQFLGEIQSESDLTNEKVEELARELLPKGLKPEITKMTSHKFVSFTTKK